MTDFLAYWILGIGPYIAAAILFGFIVSLASPWIFKGPHHWFFFAILGFNLLPITGGDPNGNAYKEMIWGLLFLIGGFHAIRDAHGRLSNPAKLIPLPLLLLVIYALISAAWSAAPIISVKRAIELIGVLIVAIAIARRMPAEHDMLDLLRIPTAFFLLTGLSLAVLAPGIAFAPDHALKAMTSQKNTWGEFSLLAAIVFLFFPFQHGPRSWCSGALAMLSAISLFESHSMTSILSFLLLLALIFIWRIVTSSSVSGWLFIAFVIGVLLLAFQGYTLLTGEMPFAQLINFLFEFIGRTPSLTGRTFLWQLMLGQVHLHPWLGVGYGGFWGTQSIAVRSVITHLDWGPPNQAHNGYIDVLNDLGIVGLAILALAITHHIGNLWKLFSIGNRRLASFHAAILLSGLLINCAESSLIRTTDFWWIVLCVSIVCVHTRLLRIRRSLNREISSDGGSIDSYHPNSRSTGFTYPV